MAAERQLKMFCRISSVVSECANFSKWFGYFNLP